jgi:hypothetical protein
MTGDGHVRFCESRRLQRPRPLDCVKVKSKKKKTKAKKASRDLVNTNAKGRKQHD